VAQEAGLIKETLRNLGLLSEEQLGDALKEQASTGKRLLDVFLEKRFLESEQSAFNLAGQFGIIPSDISRLKVTPGARDFVSEELASRHRIVPLNFESEVLTIATFDPFNFLALGNLESILKLRLEMVFVSQEDYNSLFRAQYKSGLTQTQPQEAGAIEELAEMAVSARGADLKDEEAPVIKLVDLIISQAHRYRASDIHIEPLEDSLRIRYRIDGLLRQMSSPSKGLQGPITSRIKILAGMDIAEKRLPQDGRIKFTSEGKELDLRVSSLPSLHGESLVLRILDKSSFLLGLEQIGFSDEDKNNLEKAIRNPWGMILVTGPTGSGKTTTLYAALNYINDKNRKIITVEDPVEYQIAGINQVQVKPQIGLTFASGLRSMLRQAPDVIMVGEIRDLETATIAVQAALTGHLILSTLHTNDAPSAVTRLIDMGIAPYLVASTLQAVLAQRLVRAICPDCKESYSPSKEEISAFSNLPRELGPPQRLYRGKGCSRCDSTGYLGRMGIFELLVISDELRELISKKPTSSTLRKTTIESGMTTLREDGLKKAMEGLTTLDEVIRATLEI
jgi:type II secretion system protein E